MSYTPSGLQGQATVTAGSTTLPSWSRQVPVDASGGNVTITLPASAPANNGQEIEIVRIDSTDNTVTIQPAIGQTIGGLANVLMPLSSNALHLRSFGSLATPIVIITSDIRSQVSDQFRFAPKGPDQVGAGAGSDITFTDVAALAVGVPFDGTNFTLRQGRSYLLLSGLSASIFSIPNGSVEFAWTDAAGVQLPNSATAGLNRWDAFPINEDNQTTASAVFTPTAATETVKVRIVSAAGTTTINGADSWAMVRAL